MTTHASLTDRAWRALTAPGASFREENHAGLTEPRLVAFAFGASLFLTLGRVLAETIRPELALGEDRTAWFAATILIGFSFGVLALYAFAAVIRLICRLFRGAGSWADTRLALFWSGAAAGPLIMLGHALGAAVDGRSLGALIGGAVWVIWFAPMLAAAHGFAPWKVGAVLAAACAAFLAAPNLG